MPKPVLTPTPPPRPSRLGSLLLLGVVVLAAVLYQRSEVDLVSVAVATALASPFYALLLAFLVLAAGVVLYVLHWAFIRPLNWVQQLEQVGYAQDPIRTREKVSLDTKLRRKKGKIPPPFPNGWYRLLDSRDLAPGDVKNVDCLGQHFAVYRGTSGAVSVLDAYCPHLGANLAMGGKVKGDCLECPFHGWTFNGTGKCVSIPYAEKVPEGAKTKAWPCLEINAQVLVWFDAEDREPLWWPPVIEGVQSGAWSCRGFSSHMINAHIQEVPENGADVPHLIHLHGSILFTGNDLRKTRTADGPSCGRIARHCWEATWEPGTGDRAHIADLHLKHCIRIFGMAFHALDIEVKAQQVGPSLVYLTFDSMFGKGVFLQALLPVGPLEQIISHSVFVEWKVPTFFAKFILWAEAVQVERDVMVWNNKTFQDKPLLVAEDRGIPRFRRWYSQFYSEHSDSVAVEGGLEW